MVSKKQRRMKRLGIRGGSRLSDRAMFGAGTSWPTRQKMEVVFASSLCWANTAELPDRDSLLRQREDRAGRGDAAQYVLAKRDQRRCGLGSDRA